MEATALEPGQPDGGAIPRTRKRPATNTPETPEGEVEAEVAGGSPAKVDQESAEEGPCGGGPEVHVAEAVPQNFLRRTVSIPEGTRVGCSKFRHNPGGCRACRLKTGLVGTELGCWIMLPRAD